MRKFVISDIEPQAHEYVSLNQVLPESDTPHHGQSRASNGRSGHVSRSSMFPLMEIPEPWELEKPEWDERNPYAYFDKHLGKTKADQIPVDVMDVFMLYWEANIFPWDMDHTN